MSGYIGAIPTPQATQSRDVYTATSNQTTFTTGGYTPNFVSVYLNGVHLARADYTATNGSDVVLAVGAAADDTVEIVSFATFEVSAQTFTGDVTASGGTFLPTGDTAAGDDAAIGYTAAEGLILTGQGSTNDVTIKNDADADVIEIPTGTVNVTMAGDVSIGDDLLLLSDAAVLNFGADSDVTLTHVADTGLLLSGTNVIQFNDASQNIGAPSNAILDINATDEIELNATLVDVNANLDVSGTIVGASTLSATTGTFSGVLKTDDATEATSTTDGSLQTDGGLSVVKDAVFGDDIKLLSDSAVIHFGADSDITLTHAADTSLATNGVMIATTFEPTADTAAGDNAAIGYTAAEGLILTGQGSTNDVTIKNDADTEVMGVATGATVVDFASGPTVADVAIKVAGKESIWVPAGAMYPSTTNGCSVLAQVETTALRPDLKVLDFATGADEFAQFSVAFPKSWNEGTVSFQPFWTVTGTDTGTVAWQLGGIAVSSDDTINTAFGTLVATTALAHSGTSNDLMVSVESGAVTIAGSPAAGDCCFFQINRDISADNQAGDARLLGLKLFFTTDAANDA